MSEVHHATLCAKVDQLRWMLNQTSAFSTDVYLQISNRKVNVFACCPAGIACSYSTFTNKFLRSIDLVQDHDVVALLDESDLNRFLKHLSGSSLVELKLFGSDGNAAESNSRLESSRLLIQGELNKEMPLESVDHDLIDLCSNITSRFTTSDEYMTKERTEVYPSWIGIPVNQLERLISVVQSECTEGLYPLVVKDSKLGLSLDRNHIELIPHEISGPDFHHYYPFQFEELVDTLSGDAVLSTHPHEETLVVVQHGHRGCVLRHTIDSIEVSSESEFSVA